MIKLIKASFTWSLEMVKANPGLNKIENIKRTGFASGVVSRFRLLGRTYGRNVNFSFGGLTNNRYGMALQFAVGLILGAFYISCRAWPVLGSLGAKFGRKRPKTETQI